MRVPCDHFLLRYQTTDWKDVPEIGGQSSVKYVTNLPPIQKWGGLATGVCSRTRSILKSINRVPYVAPMHYLVGDDDDAEDKRSDPKEHHLSKHVTPCPLDHDYTYGDRDQGNIPSDVTTVVLGRSHVGQTIRPRPIAKYPLESCGDSSHLGRSISFDNLTPLPSENATEVKRKEGKEKKKQGKEEGVRSSFTKLTSRTRQSACLKGPFRSQLVEREAKKIKASVPPPATCPFHIRSYCTFGPSCPFGHEM